MDDRVKAGDTIILDTDKWHHHDQDFYVHSVRYNDPSTSVELTLEDNDGNISTITVASNQVIKV